MKFSLFLLFTIGFLSLCSAATRFRTRDATPEMLLNDRDKDSMETPDVVANEASQIVTPQWEVTVGKPTKLRNLKTCWISWWIIKVCTFVVPGEDMVVTYRAL